LSIQDEIFARGRTLTKAAELIGCGVSTLGNYLNGKTEAGDELVKKLAKFLKLSTDRIPRKLASAEPAQVLMEPGSAYGTKPDPLLELRRALESASAAATVADRRDLSRIMLDWIDQLEISQEKTEKL
jgi:transcriptional regulator with XRE-family HTH domain